MIRKYAFNMILAGHRYSKSAQVHTEKDTTIWGYYREPFALTTIVLLFIVCYPTEEAFFEMLSSSSLCLQWKVMAPCWGLCHIIISLFVFYLIFFLRKPFTATGLAQSVERLTAEREVAGSIPGANWEMKVLPFALQTVRPSRGSDDHVKIVSLISIFVLNTLTLK